MFGYPMKFLNLRVRVRPSLSAALVVLGGGGRHEVEAAAAADTAHLADGAQDVVCLQRQVLESRAFILLQVRLRRMPYAKSSARQTARKR